MIPMSNRFIFSTSPASDALRVRLQLRVDLVLVSLRHRLLLVWWDKLLAVRDARLLLPLSSSRQELFSESHLS